MFGIELYEVAYRDERLRKSETPNMAAFPERKIGMVSCEYRREFVSQSVVITACNEMEMTRSWLKFIRVTRWGGGGVMTPHCKKI